jgi:hypothetical protein
MNMKAEEFFTSIVLSYKKLLSSDSDVPRLRDYCQLRHVSYPDFIRWASVNEIASWILEIERIKKRLKKQKSVGGTFDSSNSSDYSAVAGEPLLYPLHIISDGCDKCVESVVTSSTLRGIRITFPNGVKISISESDSRGIYSLIHGKEW